LAGTGATEFVSKNTKKEQPKKNGGGPPKYKVEHQKLVEALRAARKIQTYEKLKEEGKAKGPPPPLPKYEMANDDRVGCPYCGRKFAQETADRHIPVCERMNGKRKGIMAGGHGKR
jgi:hypothetical protein